VSEYLFIGGPADGERKAVRPARPWVELVGLDSSWPHHETVVVRHRYERSTVAGHSERFTVYAYEGLTGDDIMRRLIDHYRPESTP
jgi:hypothetical protein